MKFDNINKVARIICNAPGSWKQSLSHGEKLIIEVLSFFMENEPAWDIYKATHKNIDSCLERGYDMMLEYHNWDE